METISKIPTVYATAVIAKPTVPLPFSNVDIANPSMLENLEIFVPKNPPIVLPNHT